MGADETPGMTGKNTASAHQCSVSQKGRRETPLRGLLPRKNARNAKSRFCLCALWVLLWLPMVATPSALTPSAPLGGCSNGGSPLQGNPASARCGVAEASAETVPTLVIHVPIERVVGDEAVGEPGLGAAGGAETGRNSTEHQGSEGFHRFVGSFLWIQPARTADKRKGANLSHPS